jgi:hypothetical protein
MAGGPAGGRPPAPGGCRAGAGWAELAEVVVAVERLSAWARSRGEAQRALVDPVLPRLAGRPLLPVPVSPGAEEALAPLRWLLIRAGEGRGIALIRSATSPSNRNRGGPPLRLAPAAGPPRGVDDVFELWMLRDLAPRPLARCAARDGGWWPRAPAGPWPATPGRCGMRSRTDSAGATTSRRWPPNWRCCWGRPARSPRRRWWRRWPLGRWVRAGMSWPAADAGPQTVRGRLAEPLWLLEVVACAALAGTGAAGGLRFAEPGRALALEALHARATGPRPDRRGPWPLRPAVAMASPARLPHRHAAS